jgi:hypothetical protein
MDAILDGTGKLQQNSCVMNGDLSHRAFKVCHWVQTHYLDLIPVQTVQSVLMQYRLNNWKVKVWFPEGAEISLFSAACRMTMRTTYPFIQKVLASLTLRESSLV